ncbi:MAG: hypothetical protein U0401_33875 [Anaerolineae bacterium]
MIADKLTELADRTKIYGCALEWAPEDNPLNFGAHQPYYDVIPDPTTGYNLRNIRNLLIKGFSEKELWTYIMKCLALNLFIIGCLDMLAKGKLPDRLIEFANYTSQIEKSLAWAENISLIGIGDNPIIETSLILQHITIQEIFALANGRIH